MPRIRLADRIAKARSERERTHALRERRVVQAREGVRIAIDGESLVNFCSSDYLGLSQHLDVVSALQEAAAWHGVGSTASALVSGYSAPHAEFERAMADWMGYPAAIYFGSGYLANLAVMQSLLGEGDLCVQDKLNHACLIDGARMSGATLRRYPHVDLPAALRQLQSVRDGAAMLATDGVFSMDGDQAPLRELSLLARSQQALLYVDDAHGIGVMGNDGRGCMGSQHLSMREVPLLLLPLGKAFGGQGAVLLGAQDMIQHIVETARPYIFSTAASPAMAAAMHASLRLIQSESWRRAKILSLVMRFRRGALRLGLPLQESFSPIQPVVLGENQRALHAMNVLRQRGYWVSAIRPPTVPEGQARLRVTMTAAHSEADVDGLLNALAYATSETPSESAV
jgi:8-amino-7-oxononanoate synthase